MRPSSSIPLYSSAASDVYKRQIISYNVTGGSAGHGDNFTLSGVRVNVTGVIANGTKVNFNITTTSNITNVISANFNTSLYVTAVQATPVLTTITVSPGTITIGAGTTTTFTATTLDQYN